MDISVEQLKSVLSRIEQKDAEIEICIPSAITKFKVSLKQLMELLESRHYKNESSSDTMLIVSPYTGAFDPYDKSMLKRVLTTPTLKINMADINSVRQHLVNLFTELQQLACKTISKSWIKLVAPKKQSSYPYKGKELTKPPWWPNNARHKEPDHLMKSERISLMLSILLTPHLIDVPKLIIATNQCYSMIPADKLDFLFEIYLVKDSFDQQRVADLEVSDFLLFKSSRPKYHAARKAIGMFYDHMSLGNLDDSMKLLEYQHSLSSDTQIAESLSLSPSSPPLQQKQLFISNLSGLKRFSDENDLLEFRDFQPNKFSTPRPSRLPLSSKDPNLPLRQKIELENVAREKIDKLYDSSLSLSPGHILSSPSRYKVTESELEIIPKILPPMRLMSGKNSRIGVRRNQDSIDYQLDKRLSKRRLDN